MLKKLNSQNFKPFGHIIHHPYKDTHDKDKNLFHIVLEEQNPVGWRIAYLIVRDKSINRLEQHPGTFESFEPVYGKFLLYVANEKNQKDISCFYLDKPVILYKGIWHGVVTLDAEAEIKITENANVECNYWDLGFLLDQTPGSRE